MRPFVPNKNLEWYESFVDESINEEELKRPDSVSSNESSSRLQIFLFS